MKSLTLAAATVLIVVCVPASASAWVDLEPAVMAQYGVGRCELDSISEGYPDDSWKPYEHMLRRQFVKMAVEAFEIAQAFPDVPTYTDVPPTDDYYGYIEGATAAGVIEGTGDGLFGPDMTMTREQCVAIASRLAAKSCGYDLTGLYELDRLEGILGAFVDGAYVSEPFRDEMAFAVDSEMVYGSVGALMPTVHVTRIEGASVLCRSWAVVPPKPWVTTAVQAPNVSFGIFRSTVLGTDVSYHIYAPRAYQEKTEERFPVLYWLHGTGSVLPGIAPMAALFDQAIESGKIPPMLVVFANGLPYGMWSNSRDGSVPLESIVMDELIPYIDANYRTIASREGRLIEGFSMGGFGASRLGFKYPEVFGAVSNLAGGPMQLNFCDLPPGGTAAGRMRIFRIMYGGDQGYFALHSPWAIAEGNAAAISASGQFVRIVVGSSDSMLYFNDIFEKHLTDLGIPHTFTVVPGADHRTLVLLNGLGEANWEFYRTVFGGTQALGQEG